MGQLLSSDSKRMEGFDATPIKAPTSSRSVSVALNPGAAVYTCAVATAQRPASYNSTCLSGDVVAIPHGRCPQFLAGRAAAAGRCTPHAE